jgi:SAM-dependent methyltransferase
VEEGTLGSWMEALRARHMAPRTFAEMRRSVQALSAIYVEQRGRLTSGDALSGAGKRAAFALYYGPLHFLLVREVVRALGAARPPMGRVLDLGCGTGAGGAAWALEGGRAALIGIDRSGWAVGEARWTYRCLGLRGEARRGLVERATLPPGSSILAAFTVNELGPDARGDLLANLMTATRRESRIMVVEPIAGRMAPWWEDWSQAFVRAGGRADDWRFTVELPDLVRRLDEAAGLDHRELTGRSLWLGDV